MQPTLKHYIQTLYGALNEIATSDVFDYHKSPRIKVDPVFHYNAIYIIYLTISTIYNDDNNDDYNQSFMKIFGTQTTLSKFTLDYLKPRFNANKPFFVSPDEFKKVVAYTVDDVDLYQQQDIMNAVNKAFGYLMTELYDQIYIYNTQSLKTIMQNDSEIQHWLKKIGFEELYDYDGFLTRLT